MNTHNFVNSLKPGVLQAATVEALNGVISSRGKYKGYLLSNAPKQESRKAAWLAVMSFVAPVRVGIYSVMLMGEDGKALFNAVHDDLKQSGIGTAIKFFEPDFRWSLLAMRYNMDKAQTIFTDKYCEV